MQYVPGGQGIGAGVPAAQKYPGGHIPVLIVIINEASLAKGADSLAPDEQKKPAWHD